jgi:hypothetical protein
MIMKWMILKSLRWMHEVNIEKLLIIIPLIKHQESKRNSFTRYSGSTPLNHKWSQVIILLKVLLTLNKPKHISWVLNCWITGTIRYNPQINRFHDFQNYNQISHRSLSFLKTIYPDNKFSLKEPMVAKCSHRKTLTVTMGVAVIVALIMQSIPLEVAIKRFLLIMTVLTIMKLRCKYRALPLFLNSCLMRKAAKIAKF